MHAFIPLLALLATSTTTLSLPTTPLRFPSTPGDLSAYLSSPSSLLSTSESNFPRLSSTYTSKDLRELETLALLADLADKTGFDEVDLKELRLISLGEEEGDIVWVSELEKIKLKAEGRKYMDM